jgi:hypothetical protein
MSFYLLVDFIKLGYTFGEDPPKFFEFQAPTSSILKHGIKVAKENVMYN